MFDSAAIPETLPASGSVVAGDITNRVENNEGKEALKINSDHSSKAHGYRVVCLRAQSQSGDLRLVRDVSL